MLCIKCNHNRNLDLIPVLYNEIMQVTVFDDFNGQNRTVSLVPANPEADLISIADVTELESDYALNTSGDFAQFETTIDAFGEQLEAHFDSFEVPGQRELLDVERIDRGCVAKLNYPSAPLVPGTEICP